LVHVFFLSRPLPEAALSAVVVLVRIGQISANSHTSDAVLSWHTPGLFVELGAFLFSSLADGHLWWRKLPCARKASKDKRGRRNQEQREPPPTVSCRGLLCAVSPPTTTVACVVNTSAPVCASKQEILGEYAIMESVTNHGAPLQRRFRCVRARFRGLGTERSASTSSLQEIKETKVTMSVADSAMSRAHETA